MMKEHPQAGYGPESVRSDDPTFRDATVHNVLVPGVMEWMS